MLKVSSRKAIAGYAPCPICSTLSVIHFPYGRRLGTHRICRVGGCNKTIQASSTNDHIGARYTPTIEDYAKPYNVDVSAE